MSESQRAGHPAGGRPAGAPLSPQDDAPDAARDDGSGVLRVGSPQDILAFVPHCLGFQPRESLVLLGLRGSRLGATLRLDLPGPSCSGWIPGPADHKFLASYTSRITSLLAGDDAADGVLAVVYTDLPWQEGEPPPYSALMELLGNDLEDSGLRLRDGWLAGNGIWRDYYCADGACCPWPGNPLDEIAGSRLNAELVYRGSAFSASLAESARPAGRLRTAALAKTEEEVVSTLAERWSSPRVFDEVLAAWDLRIKSTARREPSTNGDEGPDAPARVREDALLLASLRSKPVRDTVLVLAAAGLETAAEGARQWLRPETQRADGRAAAVSAEAGQLFRGILIGRSRTAPDWNRLDRAYWALDALAQRAAGEPAAALLTLLGWIEWARGRSSRAELFLSGALREQPGYRLAALLTELLRRGELPQWAQSPETAWRNRGPV